MRKTKGNTFFSAYVINKINLLFLIIYQVTVFQMLFNNIKKQKISICEAVIRDFAYGIKRTKPVN